MSWGAVLGIIADTEGAEVARRIDGAVRAELRGVRLTIPARDPVTVEQINAVAPGKPKQAAAALGVHQSTVYRVLQRRRLVR